MPDRYLTIQSHRGDVPVRYHHFMTRNERWKLVHHSGFGRENFEGEPLFELYDMEADPFEEVDVAASNPDVVTELRAAYDAWFDDVGSTRPDNYGKLAIHIGDPRAPWTVLTRNDWRPTVAVSWLHPEANGYWQLEVTAPGTYRIDVRLPEGFEAGIVTLIVGGSSHTAEAAPGSDVHTFEAVSLEAGPVRLSADLNDGSIIRGAWQIEIRKR